MYFRDEYIVVQDWSGDDIKLSRRDYIRKFEDKLDFLDLFEVEDGTVDSIDGMDYFVESETEETIENVRQLVRNLAYNNFYKILEKQKEEAVDN